ncbi:hypothetical protein [Legionella impletisoli]|uniref:Uncharacterized protein n=1 Tax=Legionella impletisoli TaxID=343510 RepID=A0A917JQ91_9GAMM|nr:hypothetical protein [Legionella impletisoli]GGI77304.1 hypothetical protein GCM10007966_02520 [Legionella impletisoli]
MSLNDKIKEAVSNTFSISISALDPIRLSTSERINNFPEFVELLHQLNDERCPPKILAQSLEAVIVTIKLKEEPTELERRFLQEIETLVYGPQYETKEQLSP